MEPIFSLEFEYRGKLYGVLIKVKNVDGVRLYRITIMNGELECLLFGNNVLLMENDKLVNLNKNGMEPAVAGLHRAITDALESYLLTHDIVMEQEAALN